MAYAVIILQKYSTRVMRKTMFPGIILSILPGREYKDVGVFGRPGPVPVFINSLKRSFYEITGPCLLIDVFMSALGVCV